MRATGKKTGQAVVHKPATMVFAATGLALLLGACEPIVAQRGNLLTDLQLASLQPGEMRRLDVLNALGTPTASGTFDDTAWYYIGSVTERMGVFKPEIVQQRVVKLRFDDTGTLAEIEEIDLDQAQNVEMVGRITPTRGREFSFLEQVLGNINNVPTGVGQ